MPSPRKRFVLFTLGAGALLALIGSTQTWVQVTLTAGAAAVREVSVSGSAANAALTPIAVAAVITAVVLAIAGNVFRYVLGALTVLFGAAITVMSWSATNNPVSLASSRIAEVSGLTGVRQTEIVQSSSLSAWPWLTVLAGVIVLLAGLIALLTMRTWPVGGRKYQSSTEPQQFTHPQMASADSHAQPDRIAHWDAQNDGEDPTDVDETRDEPPANSQPGSSTH